MRRFFTTLGLLVFCTRSAIAQQQADAERNAAVQAVRSIYQETEAGIKVNRYVRHDTTVTCDESGLDNNYSFYRDSAGVVRRLDAEVGTDDHAEVHHYYYDAAGRLRFIFVQYGAVTGAHLQERVYYDENRQELRRLRERTSARSYPFGKVDPLWQPAKVFKEFCGGSSGS
jgi:YD repeat-containing protein